VPAVGRIDIVRAGRTLPKADVRARWDATAFLRNRTLDARGWLLAVLRCVERLPPAFTLADVYAFEPELHAAWPDNNNVRPKMRQQLQVLRDAGVIAFEGGGRYRRL
jgi:type II restriction enzyme